MPLSIVQQEDYLKFLATGGELRLTVNKSDIAKDRDFEKTPDIASKLRTGFELPPTPMAFIPAAIGQIIAYEDEWARVSVLIYNAGGRIIFREVSPEQYEAKLELPPMNHGAA